MAAESGKTYRVQVDVLAEEYVTILESGDLVLEDAVTGDYVVVTQHGLDDYANSDPPYSAHIVHCIRRELLSDTHDDCDWRWTQQRDGGWWYRSGRCPACGQW